MTTWREVWYRGASALADREGLESLLAACRRDDPRLVQGATTSPPPMVYTQDWPVEGCDALSWLFWREGLLESVGEVEEAFARACYEIDRLLGEPAACRHFLNWFDEGTRENVLRDLGAAVELSLMVLDCRRDHPLLWQMLTAVVTVQEGTQSGIDMNALGQAADYCQDVGLSEWSECLLWAFTEGKSPGRKSDCLYWAVESDSSWLDGGRWHLDRTEWDRLARHDYPDSGWAYLDLIRAEKALIEAYRSAAEGGIIPEGERP